MREESCLLHFTMGIPDDPECMSHLVTVAKPFCMEKAEFFQGQFKSIMGKKSSFYTDCGDDCPVEVEQVSCDEIQQFIKMLNRLDNAGKYRLPTEAEWEYACRAGTRTPFAFGNCLLSSQANYNGNFPNEDCEKAAYLEKPTSGKYPLYLSLTGGEAFLRKDMVENQIKCANLSVGLPVFTIVI